MCLIMDNNDKNKYWYEDESETEIENEGYPIDNYEITATPNDFNIITIFNFIESGSINIPGFQRNYVWDIKRASKLIESLIIGLPVPQIFLYEEARNKFLVIDGQQRIEMLPNIWTINYPFFVHTATLLYSLP